MTQASHLLDGEAGATAGSGARTTRATAFRVEIDGDVAHALDILDKESDRDAATPFQGRLWLDCWYRELAKKGAAPLVAIVREAAGGTLALALPLVRRRDGRLTLIESADFGVTDYNAPLLGPAAPTDAAGARRLWRALRRALPPADLLVVTKSPRLLSGRINPLAFVAGAAPSRLSGNLLAIDQPFESYVRGFERKFRKELGREKRVFEAIEGARFEIAAEAARAEAIMAALERMQGARIRGLGRDYRLDEPEKAAFYRALARDGVGDGRAVLTALVIGDEIVAALLGVTAGDHYAMVRLAQAGAPWSHFSPGRLMIMESMRALHQRGFRRFDFTTGDYDYKRRLGVATVQLVDVAAALSWRGRPRAARLRLENWLRRQAWARTLAARLRRPAA
jgi:CelD/BcsL family acetyltransferase involved in cellulose biosynthesis